MKNSNGGEPSLVTGFVLSHPLPKVLKCLKKHVPYSIEFAHTLSFFINNSSKVSWIWTPWTCFCFSHEYCVRKMRAGWRRKGEGSRSSATISGTVRVNESRQLPANIGYSPGTHWYFCIFQIENWRRIIFKWCLFFTFEKKNVCLVGANERVDLFQNYLHATVSNQNLLAALLPGRQTVQLSPTPDPLSILACPADAAFKHCTLSRVSVELCKSWKSCIHFSRTSDYCMCV